MHERRMKITVVGCSGSVAGPESAASCYLLEGEHDDRTWRVLLDLGSGALGPLQRYVDPLTVDAVLISHLHPDHYFDISGLYVMWKYHPDGPRAAIPVWGPAGVAKQCARAYGMSPEVGMTAQFEFHEYDDRPVRLGPFSIRVTRVAHPVPAYGMRVEADGAALAYSGDTGPCQALVELAADADLLLCEAAFLESGDNPGDLHMTGKQAGAAATEAQARRLVLTHIPPWYDPERSLAEAREAFHGPLERAVTGSTYDLSRTR
jgi:ribonuclease BN (tRNA processing enzyme)